MAVQDDVMHVLVVAIVVMEDLERIHYEVAKV